MSSPYICEVTFVDKVNLKFASIDRIDEWVRKELQAWDALFKVSETVLSQVGDGFRTQLLGATQIKLERVVAANAAEKMRILEDLSNTYITSKSVLGQSILERLKTDSYAAALMYSVSVPQLWQFSRLVSSSAEYWRNEVRERKVIAYLRAVFETLLIEKKIKSITTADKEAFEIARSDVEALHADYTASLDQHKIQQEQQNKDFQLFKEGAEKESKILFNELKGEVNNIKEFYNAELGLQMPVTYWRQKEIGHRVFLILWSSIFTAAIGLLCFSAPAAFQYILNMVGSTLSSFSEQLGKDVLSIAPWLFFVAVSFPLFLSIWILRLIAKTLISHQQQMNDASLRVVMTTTFLALMNEKKADEKDRILILNALFHVPSNVNEDGSPPHWFEILQSRLRGGT